ncbi:MAG: response regulator, partial [Chloroflexota bacterium]
MSASSSPARPRRVLVVDDEPRLIHFIRLNLEHDGFEVIEATSGSQALTAMRDRLPDLILLDVMMPDLDGFETLQLIREISTVPVIMLTAKGEEEDRVRGLELGADDYIAKPFSPREMVSRVKAVLRRTESPSAPVHERIQVDDRLTIDFDRREIFVDGKLVPLRPTEFKLL